MEAAEAREVRVVSTLLAFGEMLMEMLRWSIESLRCGARRVVVQGAVFEL